MGVQGYVFKQFSAPVGVFTDIVAPIKCNHCFIRSVNGLVLRLRTNATDATTEDLLQPGVQEAAVSPQENAVFIGYRFYVGDVVLSVQPQGASPDTVIAKFVR